MSGRINDGDSVVHVPCCAQDLAVDDVVLARVRGRRYFHLVLHKIIAREADQFLIGNEQGRLDGWVTATQIFGKVTKVEAS